MKILPVHPADRRATKEYLALPQRLAADDPLWLPDLRAATAFDLSRRHPFYEHSEAAFFLCRSGGNASGRIGVLNNRNFNRHHQSTTAFFTHFECRNDPVIAEALFRAASHWAGQRGLTRMVGPVGLLQTDPRGLMCAGYDRMSSFAIPYRPPYYTELLEASGFGKLHDYFSGELSGGFRMSPRAAEMAARVAERSGIQLKSTSNRKQLQRLTPKLLDLYRNSGTRAPLYYPPTPQEEAVIVDRLSKSACPQLIHWLEDAGSVCGLHLALPNHTEALRNADPSTLRRSLAFFRQRRRPREINISMTYLDPGHQGRGYNLMLYSACQTAALRLGCRKALVGPVHEQNRKNLQVLEKTGVGFDIIHRLYRKDTQ